MARAGRRAWVVVALLAGCLAAQAGKAPDDATYIGSDRCKQCHAARHRHITNRFFDSPMHHALAPLGDGAGVKADLAGAPFKREAVAWLLASGQTQQAYLDKDFRLLPSRWSERLNRWETVAAVDARTECLGCHATGFDRATGQFQAPGVGCEMCHGPGSAHAKGGENRRELITNPARLLETVPGRQATAFICGQCHSRGRSLDGATAFPVGFRPQGELDKVFRLDTVKRAGQNQQLNELMAGKHWQAGVVCDTCHDPHGETANPHQLRKPIADGCLVCHYRKVVDIPSHARDEGARAPADATCATCHMPRGVHYFTKEAVVADRR